MRNETVVPIERLKEEPFASVLCYPKCGRVELEERLEEMQNLNVEAIEFAGKTSVFNVPVLGKGHVGIVVIGHTKGKRIALKIRRVDADRNGLQHEARMLTIANSVLVGPQLGDVSQNFLLTQFIKGEVITEWLGGNIEEACLRRVLEEVLEQCWRLDSVALDHGELSHAPKHLIIDKEEKPFIVDFETASTKRRPANVTSICQFLFVGGFPSLKVEEVLGKRVTSEIVEAARLYKKLRSRSNFESLLQTCLV